MPPNVLTGVEDPKLLKAEPLSARPVGGPVTRASGQHKRMRQLALNRDAQTGRVEADGACAGIAIAHQRSGSQGFGLQQRECHLRNALVCLALLLAAPAWPQERPLPDFETFLQEARKRLQADDVRQSEYVYLETRREQKLDKSGRTTKETLNVFESYPALPGESRWQRQTVKDGRPLSADDLAKQDRERQKKVLEYVRRMERDPVKIRAAHEKKRAEELRETERAVDDALIVYEFKMLGREVVSGYETIASRSRRARARGRATRGKVMKHFAGKAWVSESR
jgi:hypothetical protein